MCLEVGPTFEIPFSSKALRETNTVLEVVAATLATVSHGLIERSGTRPGWLGVAAGRHCKFRQMPCNRSLASTLTAAMLQGWSKRSAECGATDPGRTRRELYQQCRSGTSTWRRTTSPVTINISTMCRDGVSGPAGGVPESSGLSRIAVSGLSLSLALAQLSDPQVVAEVMGTSL